jgi:hypothetical protein
MQRIEHQIIARQTLHFCGGDGLLLGPNVKMFACTVVLSVKGRDLICRDVAFDECNIVAKRPLKDTMWRNVTFNNCVFSGTFVDINFGFASPVPYRCVVASCDFRSASLDGCSFLGGEIRGNQFGPWPTVVVAAPAQVRDFARSLTWPGSLSDYWLPEFSPELRFQADWAPSMCKEFGVTEDDIRESFRRIPSMRDL